VRARRQRAGRLDEPKPASSIRMTRMFGAPFGGRNCSMRGFSGKRLTAKLSAMSTTFATRSAPTVAPAAVAA
jgi:hypothetical protein